MFKFIAKLPYFYSACEKYAAQVAKFNQLSLFSIAPAMHQT